MSNARLARLLLALKLLGLLTLLSMPAAFAHEVRPAYLQLHEERPGEFVVLWKVPTQGGMRLALEPQFSGKTEASTAVTRDVVGAEIRTWTLRVACSGGTLPAVAARPSTSMSGSSSASATATAPSMPGSQTRTALRAMNDVPSPELPRWRVGP